MSPGEAEPPDAFVAELEEIVTRYQRVDNLVHQAIGDGTASLDVVTRLCKEFFYLGRAYAAEFPTLLSNAPDGDALSPEGGPHYRHWLGRLADQVGLSGDVSHQAMRLEWARQLGISDEDLLEYVPMPETIGAVRTTLYFVRRSYEEGLAAFAFAGERIASESQYAKTLYEGLREHYGIEAQNFAVHAYAESTTGAKVAELIGEIAVTSSAQRRVRRAVLEVSVARGARIRAMNCWLDEQGALRS